MHIKKRLNIIFVKHFYKILKFNYFCIKIKIIKNFNKQIIEIKKRITKIKYIQNQKKTREV